MKSDLKKIIISDEMAKEFVNEIIRVMKGMSPERRNSAYLFSKSRDAIPISFDKDLKPFNGQSKGYNLEDERTYLRENVDLLREISAEMENDERTENGGRVFINFQSAYFLDGGEEIPLIKWGWTSSRFFDLVDQLR